MGGSNKVIDLSFIISKLDAIFLRGLMSSKTQAALPNVPIIKSFSLGCIIRSFTGTVGKIFDSNFSHFFPAFILMYNPSSVPKNRRFELTGSSTILYVKFLTSFSSTILSQFLP